MNGYILTTTEDTYDWVEYDYDVSVNYQEFYKGHFLVQKEVPLFYTIPKKSNLKKVQLATILESCGPTLVSKRFKEVLEANTDYIEFFDIVLLCGDEKIEGFYAMNIPYKVECIDLECSEFRLTNFDRNNPHYMFYYMKLKDNLFEDNHIDTDIDIVLCKEMPRYIVVSEKIKKALFDANLKGLQFSDSIDITPKERTVYEKI